MTNVIGALRQLIDTILFSSCKLNEIQFSAPWLPARPRCGGSSGSAG